MMRRVNPGNRGRERGPGASAMGVGEWWRGLWRTPPEAPPSVDRSELARLVGLAEAAYDTMYEARRAKEPYEDACQYFHRAIAEAQRLGPADEVARLTVRRDHVESVYNSQFRGW